MKAPVSRLEAFAERVTREMLYLWRVEDTKGYPGCDLVGTTAARAVLEREVRALAREIDCDVQGPAQSYLDAPVTK